MDEDQTFHAESLPTKRINRLRAFCVMQTTKDTFWLPSAAVLLGGTAIPVYASLTTLIKARVEGISIL